MATTTGASAPVDSDRPPPLPLGSIPIIDLSVLSQPELFSLSMCSNSSFDHNRCDDVVIPKIDRSVFNESAGSRKQTYSRLRLAPAQSSTSTKTTIHRRTPHLRPSHAPTSNKVNDAEQAENFQIIRMLKELFKSDHNFKDLVPIEVEADTNVVVPELLNTETKLKRAKPQNHEDAVFIHPPAAKRMRKNTVKKVLAYNDSGDMETVNSRGLKVNLEDLGTLEDPYGLEIRRRTEGMSTKDELLGFLGGLDGEWTTSRKKRRVVDASVFGDALPKGWRLSLSIKTKSGRVWLFCRRYISPSGREFESCKEASLYLLSIVGEENLDKSSQTQSNNCRKIAMKRAPISARNRPIVLALSSSLPRDSKKQVKPNIVNPIPIDAKVEEIFKCLKCFMIFEGKVSLLDHQVLAHKTETSQLASDWVVVKGGIFKCELCNKTINEKNQYNEHIGTHDTNDKNTPEALEAPTEEKTVDPILETDDAPSQSGDKINSGTELKLDEPVDDLNSLANDTNADVLVKESCNIDDNEHSEKEKAPDVTVSHEASMAIDENNEKFETCGVTVNCLDEKSECILEIEKKCDLDDNECHESDKDVSDSKSDFCLGHEASMSIDENNGKFETCFDAVVEKDTVSMSIDQDEVLETGVTNVDQNPESSRNSPLLPSTNEPSVEMLNLADSETRVQSPDEEKGFWENIKNAQIYSSIDDFTCEKEKVVNLGLDSKLQDSPQKVDQDITTNDFEESRFSYGIPDSRVNVDEPVNNEVNGLNLNPGFNEENNLEFSFQDDDGNRGLFLDHFSIAETCDDIFGTSPVAFEFDEERGIDIDIDIGTHDLNLDSLYENSINLGQKDNIQTNLSMVNNNNETRDFYQQQNGHFRVDDLQGGSSEVYTYNSGMEQGFGSGFWSGKNQNTGGGNVNTSVCAWCRLEFHGQQPEIEGGVGSLCPTCRAGFPGQVNML